MILIQSSLTTQCKISFLEKVLCKQIKASVAADQESQLQPGYRYVRALFTGLSLEPNFTMVMEEFKQRYGGKDPSGMALQQICQAAQEMLRRLEGQ